jgi:hypothetical protein
MSPTITPEVQTPDWFPTEVRTALDVCFRAQLPDPAPRAGSNHFPSLFERVHPGIAPLERPDVAELGKAEETLEAFVHDFLLARVGDRLETEIAVDVYRALRSVGTFTRKPRLSVCVGDLMRKVDIDGSGPTWVVFDGKDGCGLVLRGRSASCRECQRTQTTRHARQLAEWRQNYRAILEYPVYFPDGTLAPLGLAGVSAAPSSRRRIFARRAASAVALDTAERLSA